ncbi:MAG: UDP-N-acetylmuramate dehydrogenase [Lentisphaerae bacterium]|nr:UDP-N-acetylmuramate dehydrogenase [Lentisphaerota bacterium]
MKPAGIMRALQNGRAARVHLIGIGGIGMAGLAVWLKARGVAVEGCDRAPGETAAWLERQGIPVRAGHAAEHMTRELTAVIRTAAVPGDAAEPARARALGIPVWRRGEVLAALLDGVLSVAVAGTHGKTTTAWLIAQVLLRAGRDPAWCIGGELAAAGAEPPRGPGAWGGGRIAVAEADESDGTLACYAPDIAVVTNLEYDHLEYFSGRDALEACFGRFLRGAARAVIYNGSDPVLRRLVAAAGAAARAVDFTAGPDGAAAALPWPGAHNRLNARAAAAACRALGLDEADIEAGLAGARRPRRRFECVAEDAGIRVISDYAHHPTEIRAVIRTAAALPHRRLLAVFQPHRYSRTRGLRGAFPAAFEGLDELLLLPVYAASEAPAPGGRTWDLYGAFRAPRAADGQGGNPPVPKLADSLEQAWDYFRRTLREGDILLILGAGDVERIAAWARAEGPRGGTAPVGRETTVASEAELAALLRETHGAGVPLHVLGAGSNTIVDDLGVAGVRVRLKGRAFEGVAAADGLVTAGAAVPLARLLDRLEAGGWAGLEFLEGIPGTVGGALAMNAGAAGEALARHTAWIQCLNRDGSPCTVSGEELEARYRACGALRDRGRVALRAGFRVRADAPAAVAARRAALGRRRAWMQGLSCKGSVFKNPPGDHAGRLIEAAGLKGLRIGGARVYEGHANVIVTDPGATASDVKALMETVRAAVEARFGVRLENEVIVMA